VDGSEIESQEEEDKEERSKPDVEEEHCGMQPDRF
jgi:hypothetical protein